MQALISAADGRDGRTFTAVPVTVVDACAGDCTVDGQVTIDELTIGLPIALGAEQASACAAIDAGGDR